MNIETIIIRNVEALHSHLRRGFLTVIDVKSTKTERGRGQEVDRGAEAGRIEEGVIPEIEREGDIQVIGHRRDHLEATGKRNTRRIKRRRAGNLWKKKRNSKWQLV